MKKTDKLKRLSEKIVVQFLAFFWPEVCPFCRKAYRTGICPACRKKLFRLQVREPRCMQCGKPVRYEEQELCYDCMHTEHFFDRGLSLWIHRDPVNQSIYQFKYHNQRRYGIYYAREFVCQYSKTIKAWNPDVIIPIPLHKKRRKKRGYNQAEIIARHLGTTLGIPVDCKSLARKTYTDPQKTLGPAERRKNLKGVFFVPLDFHPVETVLLIDDIYTTGSTMDAAAEVLKKRGDQRVYFLTISIGQGY